MRILISVFLLGLGGGVALASPLFDSEEVLSVSIEAPMRELIRQRLDKAEYDAVVQVTDASGAIRKLPARIAPRGNARLEVCSFPPLRLDFDRDQVTGTLFEGQQELKIVTQCGRGDAKQTWLLLEYGLYRAYNELTDFSYRVRKLEVTFQDSESKRWQRTTPAFVIESTEEAAERLARQPLRPPEIRSEQFEPFQTTLNVLFQFLIANTDFAIKRGPAGEGCCHNGRVLTPPGAEDNWVVLPYDFDQAGIIATDYALPDERLGIRRVTSRLYRGFCWHNESLPAAIAVFNERRERLTAVILAEVQSDWRQKRARQFIDAFYEIINDPRELETQLTAKCRGAESFPVQKTITAEK